MKDAAFLYKCKNCGKIFDSGDRSAPDKMKMYFYALVLGYQEEAKKMFAIGTPPSNITTHVCDNDEIGVAELVAFRNEVTPKP